MAQPLHSLRRELDIMPSPVPDRPGILIRDPFQYSDAMIIVPPLLAQGLALFDGEHTDLDLRALLTRLTGELETSEMVQNLIQALDLSGFLESERFFEMRDGKQRAFAEAELRLPAHAESGYPAEPGPLRAKLTEYGADPETGSLDSLAALAAPHVSPEGGFRSYAAAYRRLSPSYADHTFVILGTSHYGQPEKFGLTRKPYVTPFGALRTDRSLVDRLAAAAPDAIVMEDYCHATEHSIEFQCVFLQHALGTPEVEAVPILCGPLVESLLTGKAPESNQNVRRFFDALGEMAAKLGDKLIWVLGVDMAHIGRRYGDRYAAKAGQGPLAEVRARDEQRLERICEGDAAGFFELVHPNHDDLRWCGYSPIYTFLHVTEKLHGEVLSYEQWNIDQQSVVSFAGVEFRRTS
jgi:AmmeMemoRadiSam system protein B